MIIRIFKRLMFKNEKPILLLIFIIALTLRLMAVINLPVEYSIPHADAYDYHNLALNLLNAKGFISDKTGLPTSYRMPLYPIFIALIYSVFGINYFAVRIIQSIMSALLCILIFYIAERIFNRKIALLSTSILAFYQPYIFYLYFGGPGFLLSENLYSFLFALFIYYLVSVIFAGASVKKFFFSGLLFGLTTLTRPEIVFFPAFLFILIYCYKDKYRFLLSLKYVSFFLLGAGLVILPWTARNCFVHKAFVPLTTYSGYNLWQGNNPYSSGSWGRGIEPFSEKDRFQIENMSEVQKDKFYFMATMKFLFNNYKKIPYLFLKKLLVFWNIFNENGKYNIWYGIIFIFGLFGIYRTVFLKTNNIGQSLIILIFLYFSLIAMVFLGDPRFRFPVEPYLIIFCSAGIFSIYNCSKNKASFASLIFFVIVINVFFYIHSNKILNFIKFISKNIGLS